MVSLLRGDSCSKDLAISGRAEHGGCQVTTIRGILSSSQIGRRWEILFFSPMYRRYWQEYFDLNYLFSLTNDID